MVKRNGDQCSQPAVADDFDGLPIQKTPRLSPRPLLKRQRAQYFDDKSAVVVPTSVSSNGSSSTTILVRDEHDMQMERESDRRSLLRELGVPESFPIRVAMEIPLEYFWNDQHPSECSCHWCNVLFGSDRFLLVD